MIHFDMRLHINYSSVGMFRPLEQRRRRFDYFAGVQKFKQFIQTLHMFSQSGFELCSSNFINRPTIKLVNQGMAAGG
jgi:hypothetical protein